MGIGDRGLLSKRSIRIEAPVLVRHEIYTDPAKQVKMNTQNDCQYDSLLDAVEDLKKQGYTDELTIREDGLFNSADPLDPKDFTIDSFHRFEGPTDPADESILYAISSEHLGLHGILIGDYGSNAMDYIHKMVKPLAAHGHEDRKVKPVQPAEPGQNAKR